MRGAILRGAVPPDPSPPSAHVVITDLEAVRGFQGADLGTTAWFTIDQARIERFARATGDTRWLHLDPERAARDSPWKNTVADGYLLLSLVPNLLPQLIEVRGWRAAINVGADHCTFPGVVTEGSRVRLGARVGRARSLPPSGAHLGFEVWFEVEGSAEPVARGRVSYAYFA